MPTHYFQGREYLGQPQHTALLAGLGMGPHIAREPLEDHQKHVPLLPETTSYYGYKQKPSSLLRWCNAAQDCHV